MALNRRLLTDDDFEEAVRRELRVRVFQDDFIVSSGGIVIRFEDGMVAVQTSVSDVAYYDRQRCEFFEIRKS
ncbi:hypothetical protein [Paenibacillus sp. NPDC058071]|uniref:hypothetical protein n=1 Tax=Paenibacillus sp. NPDC058071 TaxID=3346326 RepID=UPI0036D7EA66